MLAIDAITFASAGADEETIYEITRALHGNKEALVASFPAFNGFDPEHMARTLDPIQYHPGAVHFYEEVGLMGEE